MSKKHRWHQPLEFSHDFRKSIAVGKALINCEYICTNEEALGELGDRGKEEMNCHGWQLCTYGEKTVATYDGTVLLATNYDTIYQAEYLIRLAIKQYEKNLKRDNAQVSRHLSHVV